MSINVFARYKRMARIASFTSVVFASSLLAVCKQRTFNKTDVKAARNNPSDEFNLNITEEEFKLIRVESGQAEFPQCAAKLGTLPDFTCVENDLDDTAGVAPDLIDKPFTRSVEVFLGHVGTSAEKNYVRVEGEGKCDNPAQLGIGTSCFSGSRIGTLPSFDRDGKLMKHIKSGFICRRYSSAPTKPGIGYSDVAVIQTNTKTGESCFYQFLKLTTVEKIPSPFKWDSLEKLKSGTKDEAAIGKADLKAGKNFFVAGGTSCTNCHDSSPFIHTRHVESIIRDGKELNRPIIPKQMDGLKSNYSVVTSPGRISSHVFVENKEHVKDGRDACTTCHKIGRSVTCKSLANTQWFGDFLSEHARMDPAYRKACLEATIACCAGSSSETGNFSAKTASGLDVQCGTQDLPFADAAALSEQSQ